MNPIDGEFPYAGCTEMLGQPDRIQIDPTTGDVSLDSTMPTPITYTIKLPKRSGWVCYLFGNRPGMDGIKLYPTEGTVPNAFVRWMMKVCFDCLWVKEK